MNSPPAKKREYRLVHNNTYSTRRRGFYAHVEKWGRSLISHLVLYICFVAWVLISPILLAFALLFGILKGKGLVYIQSWGFLTTYLACEFFGTFWCMYTTFYAIVTGSFPYSNRFKTLHCRMATKWCAFIGRFGHWVMNKKEFIRLPESGIQPKKRAPVILAMR